MARFTQLQVITSAPRAPESADNCVQQRTSRVNSAGNTCTPSGTLLHAALSNDRCSAPSWTTWTTTALRTSCASCRRWMCSASPAPAGCVPLPRHLGKCNSLLLLLYEVGGLQHVGVLQMLHQIDWL
jgi:hypothetical protein